MKQRQTRLAEETFGDVLRLFRVVQANMQSLEKQSGLSGAQLWALWQLSVTPGMKVSHLAESLFIHMSTASNLLDKLEKKGYLHRSRSPADSRVVFLHLTPEGEEVVRKLPGPLQGKLRNALQQMPAAKLDELRNGIVALLAQMEGRTEPIAGENGAG
ncbi:MAG: MarR family transcriptional regulator [Rhodocyclaceae bacterium]|jgi:DNA-binding MarR family transcriptional regulator|nr:MarR family transcriptional regulator [Rhodocyclaceae bacterium]